MIKDIPNWEDAIQAAKDEIYTVPINPDDFQAAAKIIGKALELLLISKNEKYGKDNILGATRFGMTAEQGLMLRENDKTERILNSFKGKDLGKEGLLESFGDKCGYAAIGMMLRLKTKDTNWYELPISEYTGCDD